MAEQIVNGRNRKEYTITEKGREQFRFWLSQEIGVGKVQDEGLLKLFFMTEIPKEKRIALLTEYTMKLSLKIEELRIVESESLKTEVPAQYQEAFNYRIETLKFGKQYYEFELNWYNDIIQKIKENKI